MVAVGKFLRAVLSLQKRDKITQERMAEFLGISVMHWWRIRHNKSEFQADLKVLCVGHWQEELLPIFLSENVKATNNMRGTTS